MANANSKVTSKGERSASLPDIGKLLEARVVNGFYLPYARHLLVTLRQLRDSDAIFIEKDSEITPVAAICMMQLANQIGLKINLVEVANQYRFMSRICRLNALMEAAENFLSIFGEFDLKTGEPFSRPKPKE